MKPAIIALLMLAVLGLLGGCLFSAMLKGTADYEINLPEDVSDDRVM